MNLIFIGTAEFGVSSLRAVDGEHEVELVITQPDRPSGRGMKPGHSPIKEGALEIGLPVYQPEDINSSESLERIGEIAPDGFVLAAYGQKISGKLLNLVRWPVNIHGSLLPKYRGAAPINWAVIRGEQETGITTIIMDEGLDSGPVLLKEGTEIGKNETAGQVHDRLRDLAADLILETLAGLEEGTVEPKPQEGEPSFAPKLSKEDGLIDWNRLSARVHDHVRGTYPWPGAYTFFDSERINICRTRDLGELRGHPPDRPSLGEEAKDARPGEVINTGSPGLFVKCARETAVELTEVKPPSRSKMSGTDFVNGYHLELGDRFTSSG